MKIPKCIIELYKVHLHIYLDFMEKSTIISNLPNENQIIYYGWKMFLNILSILYLLNKSNKEINKSLQESYLLYLEYIEQIYAKHLLTQSSPSSFVMKTIIGHIKLNDFNEKNKEQSAEPLMFTKIYKWTSIISQWNNKNFSISDRQILNVAFLTNYLEHFTDDSYCYYLIIENIQTVWSTFSNYWLFHVILLDLFYKFVKSQKKILSPLAIKEICQEKFIINNSLTRKKIEKIQYNNDVNDLIEWLFT